MLRSRRSCVHSRVRHPALKSSVLVVAVLCSSCVFGRLSTIDQKTIVDRDVPGMLEAWLPRESSDAAARIPASITSLRSKGWSVEEFHSGADTTYADWYSKYSGRQYLINVPDQVMKKPEFGNDLLSSAMVDQWHCWSAAFAERFSENRTDLSRLPKIAAGDYFRAISPDANRVYDIVIIRSPQANTALIEDRLAESGIEILWRNINPAKSDEFPRCMFKDVRFVEPEAAKRLTLGRYVALEVYARRYYPGGTFLHASYGKSRGRDTYILALVSPKTFIVVQTDLYADTTRDTFVGDLRQILDGQ
jgi:hypothetical protein